MKKFLLSAFALVIAAVAFAQPTTVPVPTGDDIVGIYGSQLNHPVGTGFNFYDWGSGSPGTVLSVDGKEVFKIEGLKWYGSQFSDVDASNKAYVHLDIYPEQDMDLAVALICWNDATNGNWGERGVNNTLTGGQWNSIDIEMQALVDRGGHFEKLYQIKFVEKVVSEATDPAGSDGFQNGDGTKTFYIGNIYAYGTRVIDTEAPVMVSAAATEVGGNQVTLTMKATDNNDNVTFIITDAANNKTYEAQGTAGQDVTTSIKQLNAETAYSWNVKVKDMAGNLSENSIDVTFTTGEGFKLTAAPVPTHSTDDYDIFSIYSDAYDKAPEAINAFFNTWGSAGEQFVEETVDGDHIWHAVNFGYMGNEFTTTTDLTGYTVHMDLLATELTQVGLTPITQSGENSTLYNVTTGQWTSLDIPLSDWSTLNPQYTFQFKWDRGNSQSDLYIDNFYFYKSKGGETPAEVTAITIEASANELEAGKTLQLSVKDQNGNDVTTGLTFNSSNNAVATVDETGLVSAVAEGTVKITATYVAPTTGTGAPARAPGDPITAEFDLTVTPAAEPGEGQVLTANGHTVTLTGYHYTDTDNYELYITSEEQMTGLGGSFWHINGNETSDIRTNMEISQDGHTIICSATSNTEPQLYTPLFVLMPGEVNFGEVTINWIEKGNTVGISNVNVDNNKNFNVYSIDGRVMQRGGESLINLPAGIYIVNGKKVVVK